MASATATDLGRGHLPWSGVSEEKPVRVDDNEGSVYQLEGQKIACSFL